MARKAPAGNGKLAGADPFEGEDRDMAMVKLDTLTAWIVRVVMLLLTVFLGLFGTMLKRDRDAVDRDIAKVEEKAKEVDARAQAAELHATANERAIAAAASERGVIIEQVKQLNGLAHELKQQNEEINDKLEVLVARGARP